MNKNLDILKYFYYYALLVFVLFRKKSSNSKDSLEALFIFEHRL